MLDYDVVIVGGSLTGRYAAATAAQMQARVALVEPQPPQDPIGQIQGDLYRQALVIVSQILRQAKQVQTLGLSEVFASGLKEPIAWDNLQYWATQVTANAVESYSLGRLATQGVDVIMGQGEFISKPGLRFRVNQRILRSRTYLLAMAGQPRVPEIPGLSLTGFLTPQTIGKLYQLPQKLVVVGGDPGGIELAQVFAQLGSQVTIAVQSPQILAQEDPEAAHLIQAQLEAEGIQILTRTEVIQAQIIQKQKWLQVRNKAIEVDEILLATGQRPQLSQFNLEAVGVEIMKNQLPVNSKLQTTNPRIYACGAVLGGYSFVHLANYEAKIALKNALYWPRFRVCYRGIPWAIFSNPQLARVGLTEQQAEHRYGNQVWVHREYFKTLPRALLQGETTGFLKLIGHQNGKLLGATVVGAQSSEMINSLALAIRQNLSSEAIAELPQPWLTFSEIIGQTTQAELQHRHQKNTVLFDWIENFFHWRRYWL
ncbi:MAG: dihydrolipoyl dehydrogenase family protein [Microcoleaceae cyanobacterium]